MQKKNKLIMTLLARDEGDIIRQNIEHHLNKGVDFIIATDNASVDNTREIMLEYQKRGLLFLIDELGRNKSQAAWNNRMTRIAREKFDADAIFHCDADEFWCPQTGNLKDEIFSSKADVFSVEVFNVLLENQNGNEEFPRDAKYLVSLPINTENFREDSKNDNLYLFRYPPKVFFKTAKGMIEVTQGNHSIANRDKKITIEKSEEIEIYHFPLRGKQRFFRKVIETGKAVERNNLLKKNQSWHIRRWYDAYKNGFLEDEYHKLTITHERAKKLMAKGILQEFNFNKFIMINK